MENREDTNKETLQVEAELLELFKQPGWIRIKAHIEEQIATKIELLIMEKVDGERTRLQAEISAYRTIPNFIFDSMVAADAIRSMAKEDEYFSTDLN